MKCAVKTLENKDAGSVDLNADVFGLPKRTDILARMVNWQLAKRRAGTHKTKGVSEIRGTTAKPFKQKGTGRARQGTVRAPQMRGGAVIFGPTPRSHAHGLPKKVRKLALMTALSAKQADGKIVILDDAKLSSPKTKDLTAKFAKMGITSALIIDGPQTDSNLAKAAANIPGIDVLPQQGANVYDILRRDILVLTKEAVSSLQARLGKGAGK